MSTELVINELSYNAKEKYLDLTDFYFGATTLLGKDDEGREIGEGMLGARADITDFCHHLAHLQETPQFVKFPYWANTDLSAAIVKFDAFLKHYPIAIHL